MHQRGGGACHSGCRSSGLSNHAPHQGVSYRRNTAGVGNVRLRNLGIIALESAYIEEQHKAATSHHTRYDLEIAQIAKKVERAIQPLTRPDSL